jgi:hypothetical protein
VVESTALEMRHTGNRIGGSNPSLSVPTPFVRGDTATVVRGDTAPHQDLTIDTCIKADRFIQILDLKVWFADQAISASAVPVRRWFSGRNRIACV